MAVTWWHSDRLLAQWGLALRPEAAGWLCLAMGLSVIPGPDDRMDPWKGLWLLGTVLVLLGSTVPTSLAGYVLGGWAIIAGNGSPHWRWPALGDAAMAMALLGIQTALGTSHWQALNHAGGVGDLVAQGWPFLLLVVAVAVRSAQFPFHAWLTTGTHSLHWLPLWSLPLFVLLFRLFPVWGQHPQLGMTLAAVGGLGMVIAGGVSWCQDDPPKVAVWLTLAQTGWLLLALGAGELGTMQAALVVTVLASAILAAGVRLEVRWLAFGGGVALTGLPFVSGLFWSQSVLADHLLQHGYGFWFAVAILGQLVMTASVVRGGWRWWGDAAASREAWAQLARPTQVAVIGSVLVWLGGLPLTLTLQETAIGGLPLWPSLLVLGLWLLAWGGVSWRAWKGWPIPGGRSNSHGLWTVLADAGQVERFFDAVARAGGRQWAVWGRRLENLWETAEAGLAVGTVLVGEGLRRLQGWQVSSYAGVVLMALVVALWITG